MAADQDKDDFEDLVQEVYADLVARGDAKENGLRRELAQRFDAARRDKNLSLRDLAKLMHTSVSQVQRVLHEDLGGSLSLTTLCRAADVLGLELTVQLAGKEQH